jgi:hypothetical protein
MRGSKSVPGLELEVSGVPIARTEGPSMESELDIEGDVDVKSAFHS